MKSNLVKALFLGLAVLMITSWISSGVGLLCGILMAVILGNPFLSQTKLWTSRFLSFAVVGLGAGMNLNVIGRVGLHGIGYTIVGISLTLILGVAIGKFLKTEKETSMLITVGTAICGGSAIAAVASVIRAKNQSISVALGTVFILNAIALFVFPWIGHHFLLSQDQFGLWSALAIHDTSSVVGATLQYGPQAVEVGTTIKLARALWIVPVSLGIGYLYSQKHKESGEVKAKKPWFILGFLIMAALVTYVPSLVGPGHYVEAFAKRLMVLTLFLIGSNLTKDTLRSVGPKPFFQGVILWILMAASSLSAILAHWIEFS